MEKKPNIILFMADQQAAIHRKKEGFEADTMPFLDEFAGQGVDFCRAYSECGYGGSYWDYEQDVGLDEYTEGAMARPDSKRLVGYDCLNT